MHQNDHTYHARGKRRKLWMVWKQRNDNL